MDKVITIYDAKTNLSKLVKQAKAGKTIYIGSYGHAEAIIAPLPAKPAIRRPLGILAHKRDPNFDSETLVGPDPEINALIEESINRPFPS